MGDMGDKVGPWCLLKIFKYFFSFYQFCFPMEFQNMNFGSRYTLLWVLFLMNKQYSLSI